MKGIAPELLGPLGRFGYTAKGLVYCLVGLRAGMAALGFGGYVGGSREARKEVGAAAFGGVMLLGIGLGLLAYAFYRGIQAWVDPGDQGLGVMGLAKRAAYLGSAAVQAALGVFALSLLWKGPFGSSGGEQKSSDRTAELMAQPFGVWLVSLVGVGVFALGLRQLQRAYQAGFMDHYDPDAMGRRAATFARRAGRVGLSARGLVFLLVGGFVVKAALERDPSESRGLSGALSSLREQPYGDFLLGGVGAGLFAYGVFCFTYARYRAFRDS